MLNPTKHLVSIAALLSLLSAKLHGLTISKAGCGTEKGCFMFPTSCSDNCDFLVTYKVNGSNKLEFELSGKGDWAAVGFSNDQLMPDTDILMCVSNQAMSGHYYASGKSTPTKTTPTPAAVTIIEQANGGGMIKCRISRDINPSPIQNFRNLNLEVYLLGAVGSLDGSGSLQQHSSNSRQSSSAKVNVAEAESPTTTATTQGSFGIPEACSSSENCDFLVTFQKVGEDKVEFELSGKAGWAGVGFSDDQLMADTDMLICVSDKSKSGHYYASGRTTPTMTTPTPSAVTIIEHSNDGGVVKCKISRDIKIEIENFRDLSKAWFLLGATGPFSGEIQEHSVRQPTNSRIVVTDASGSASGSSGIHRNVIVHGTLMTLAWILFAFVGLFTARYMRQVWEPRQLLGTKAWFAVHRTLMTLTVLLTVAGVVVIFVHVEGWSSNAGVHPYFGIVVVALALAQPIMAAFRPHPGEPRRNIFNWTHRIVGTTALILGVVAIFFGLDTDQVGLGKKGLYAVICFYIGEFFVFVFEVYLILSRRNREKRSVPVGTTRDIPMEQPGHQNRASPEPEMPLKEAMIRTFMFVFVVLVGASVSLTIILLMVLK